MQPEPVDTGAEPASLSGSWTGTCDPPPPPTFPIQQPPEVQSLAIELVDANGVLSGTVTMDVIYSVGGLSILLSLNGDVTGLLQGLTVSMTFDWPQATGIGFDGQLGADGDTTEGNLDIPQAAFGDRQRQRVPSRAVMIRA
ncbi:MAG: hypothetical protein AAGA48_39795 [Myxococcota bacterium]